MAKVISFINYKGGVGKTTTTFHIGCALAMFEPKKKVLLIDADPQTNLTFLCCDFKSWEHRVKVNGSLETVYSAYLDQKTSPLEDIIWKKPMARPELSNVDLVPSTIELLDIDLRLQSKTHAATTIREVAQTHLDQRSILLNAIKEIADQYDYVLIDCPPNLYLATQNALYASDGYLVTLMPDHFSTVGVTFLDRKVRQLLKERNLAEQIVDPNSEGARRLPSYLCFVKVNVTAGRQQIVAREQMAIVRGMPNFKDKCFDTHTEDYKDIREATTEQLPVFLNSSGSQNDVLYRRMAEEFREKLG
ncbi:MAG: AAA family ATPase [Burkholderiales bacterium]|nr:AAA family ATPase [Burkholderiales bacterium]